MTTHNPPDPHFRYSAHRNYSAHYDVHTKYFGVTKDATMAVELSTTQFQACQDANGQFCSITTPFQPLANPPSCIAALYAKSKADIASKCSLQICKASTTNLPTQIAPDVWILTTPVTAPTNTMTLICLEKPMETMPIQKPIHILKLPMACSATSSNFYLPPRYETPNFGCQHISQYGKSSHVKHFCTEFPYMATSGKQ